ncbi:hypothetical protein [Actinomyces urinae]|uniref:hypothetical protein n=1 Tax=Actinomyces urinae TaxID=1689268 RepID=UPI000930DB9B|nr:hypothetical protein [Actinomyces urinae]
MKRILAVAGAAVLGAGVAFAPALAADTDAINAAQADVDWFCTEGTETFDMAACADAEAALKALLEEPQAPAEEEQAPAGDSVKQEIADKELDEQYFCAEGTEYFDHIKCGQIRGEIEDAKIKDAELDVTWFCAEGTEYYDMVKCAEATDRLNTLRPTTPETSATEQDPTASEDITDPSQTEKTSETTVAATEKPSESKVAAGEKKLAKTGASVALLGGAAAALAGGGALLVTRRRSL